MKERKERIMFKVFKLKGMTLSAPCQRVGEDIVEQGTWSKSQRPYVVHETERSAAIRLGKHQRLDEKGHYIVCSVLVPSSVKRDSGHIYNTNFIKVI